MGDLSASLPGYFGFSGVKAVKERGNFILDLSENSAMSDCRGNFLQDKEVATTRTWSVREEQPTQDCEKLTDKTALRSSRTGLLSSAKAVIHKSNSNPHEIFARYNLLKQIENAGFRHTDGIIPAVSGAPFVNLGRDIFVMTRHVKGREPDLGNVNDMKSILESLARLHMAARDFTTCPEIPVSPPMTEIFEKGISSFNAAVKQINRRPRLSDFDVLMLKHADFYLSLAEKALETLEQTDYSVLYANALTGSHICHNALKEETFSIAEDTCYISRFDDASVDLQLTDLASVLRRYARKSSREISVTAFTRIYENILPLPASAKKILFAQLSFPFTFFKTVSQYYSKKRNFVPAAITSRMTGILEEQENYSRYIRFLCDNIDNNE